MPLLVIFVFYYWRCRKCYFYVTCATFVCVCYTQSFQWRVSRVVEPQVNQPKEKVYSIASALPRPCYSSLLSQLTNVPVRNEERVAFSQTEYSSLNTAQQLTLLQQVPREQGALLFHTLDFCLSVFLLVMSYSSLRGPFSSAQTNGTSGIRKVDIDLYFILAMGNTEASTK